MHTALLSVHIVFGTLALIVGIPALFAAGRHGWFSAAALSYQVIVVVICASTIGLAILTPAFWSLALIAVATEIAAAVGWVLGHRPDRNAASRYIRWTGGSYVALVTALVVVSTFSLAPGAFLIGLVPIVVGRTIVERAARRARQTEKAPQHENTTEVEGTRVWVAHPDR